MEDDDETCQHCGGACNIIGNDEDGYHFCHPDCGETCVTARMESRNLTT